MEGGDSIEDVIPDEGDLFQVDETLNPLEAILRYSRSPIEQQRHVFLQGLAAAASNADSTKEVGQLVEVAVEALESLPDDSGPPDPATLVLVLQQLGSLGTAAAQLAKAGSTASDTSLVMQLVISAIGVLASCCDEEDQEVQHAALSALSSLLQLLPPGSATQLVIAHATATASLAVPKLEASSWGPQGSPCQIDVQEELSSMDHGVGMHLHATFGLLAGCRWLMSDSACAQQLTRVATDLALAAAGEVAQEEVQQAAAAHVVHIAQLLPTLDRGPAVLVPALTALSDSPTWRVRQAAATIIPDAIHAVAGHDRLLDRTTPSIGVSSLDGGPAAAARPGNAGVGAGAGNSCKVCSADGSGAGCAGEVQASMNGSAAGNGSSGDTNGPGNTELECDAVSCMQLVQLLVVKLGCEDVSQWVRCAAAKACGPAICAAPRTILQQVPQLMALYALCAGVQAETTSSLPSSTTLTSVSQVEGSRSNSAPAGPEAPRLPALGALPKAQAKDLAVACAGCLAGVVRQAEKGAWTATSSLLPRVYTSLLATSEPAVLRALAPGLPFLAACIGPGPAASQLLPPLIAALVPAAVGGKKLAGGTTMLQAVAAQLVPGLARLACALPYDARGQVVGLLRHLVQDTELAGGRCGEWRVRMAVASQLAPLAEACAAACPNALHNTLLPVAHMLCADPVAAVRHEASRQLGHLLLQLATAETSQVLSGTIGPATHAHGPTDPLAADGGNGSISTWATTPSPVGSPAKPLPGSGATPADIVSQELMSAVADLVLGMAPSSLTVNSYGGDAYGSGPMSGIMVDASLFPPPSPCVSNLSLGGGETSKLPPLGGLQALRCFAAACEAYYEVNPNQSSGTAAVGTAGSSQAWIERASGAGKHGAPAPDRAGTAYGGGLCQGLANKEQYGAAPLSGSAWNDPGPSSMAISEANASAFLEDPYELLTQLSVLLQGKAPPALQSFDAAVMASDANSRLVNGHGAAGGGGGGGGSVRVAALVADVAAALANCLRRDLGLN